MYSLTQDVFCFHTWLNKSCIFCVISVELWEKLNHLPFFWGRRYKHSSGDWIRILTSPEQKVSQTWLPQTPILRHLKKTSSIISILWEKWEKMKFPCDCCVCYSSLEGLCWGEVGLALQWNGGNLLAGVLLSECAVHFKKQCALCQLMCF